MIRVMTEADYSGVYALWKRIDGMGIRCLDDSKEGVAKFLRRNPATSFVAEEKGVVIGCILCGHDGRTGSFYHVCVDPSYRNKGIGTKMAKACLRALKSEGINKAVLIAFRNNEIGNGFWKELGWEFRKDINYYDFSLNDGNQTVVIRIAEEEEEELRCFI